MTKKFRYRQVIDQPFYTEGPVVDALGNVFFTTLAGGKIVKLNGDKTQTHWAETVCPNGQIILDNGDHLVCDSKLGAIVRYNADGKLSDKVVDGVCAGEAVTTPNDLIADEYGNIYFTDSVRHHGKVYFLSTTGQQRIVARDLDYPNGLALSKDQQTLFVAESYRNRILAFDLSEPGTADGSARVFASLPTHSSGDVTRNLPDGIKTDDENNLWVAHYGMGMLQVLSPGGALVQSIPTGMDLTSNLFIRGRQVIITGGHSEPGPGAVVEIEIE